MWNHQSSGLVRTAGIGSSRERKAAERVAPTAVMAAMLRLGWIGPTKAARRQTDDSVHLLASSNILTAQVLGTLKKIKHGIR